MLVEQLMELEIILKVVVAEVELLLSELMRLQVQPEMVVLDIIIQLQVQ